MTDTESERKKCRDGTCNIRLNGDRGWICTECKHPHRVRGHCLHMWDEDETCLGCKTQRPKTIPALEHDPITVEHSRNALDVLQQDLHCKNHNDGASEEVMDELVNPHCQHCEKNFYNASPPLKRCARCHIAYYCNETCQVNHWNNGWLGHEHYCYEHNIKTSFY